MLYRGYIEVIYRYITLSKAPQMLLTESPLLEMPLSVNMVIILKALNPNILATGFKVLYRVL